MSSPVQYWEEKKDFIIYQNENLNQKKTISLQTLSLENKYLCISLLPEQEGKIINFFDKRTHQEILIEDSEKKENVFKRKIEWFANVNEISFLTCEESKKKGKYKIQEYENETQILIMSQPENLSLTLYQSITLSENHAWIELGFKVFNFGWEPIQLSTGLTSYYPENAQTHSSGWWCPQQKIGLGIVDKTNFWSNSYKNNEFEWLHLAEQNTLLESRSWRSWKVKCIPLTKGLYPIKVTSEGYIGYKNSQLSLQVTQPFKEHKLILEVEKDKTFELITSIYPEKIEFYDLKQFNSSVVKGVLRNPYTQIDVLDFSFNETQPYSSTQNPYKEMIDKWKKGDEFRKLASKISARGSNQSIPYHLLALQKMQHQNWSDAKELILEALSFQAEDPGLWWAQAACERHLNELSDSLMNALYLSPMDPLLKIETFLSQSTENNEKETSLLIENLEPEAMVLATCQLMEAGLWKDAILIAETYLKLKEFSRLRALLAWSYMKRKGMQIESELNLKTFQTKWQGSLPWHWIELKAFEELNLSLPIQSEN